jgi:hypothetical protein
MSALAANKFHIKPHARRVLPAAADYGQIIAWLHKFVRLAHG